MLRILLIILLNITLFLTGCASKREKARDGGQTRYTQQADSAPARSQVPKNLHKIPNAIPKLEPKSKYGNPASYVVYNKKYHVLPSSAGYKSTGLASWYGSKFHGYRTSSGELYDMYGMTAAHKTLPLPTYVRVKNLDNGREVIVKVNDRGPFHGNRLLDLSYAAATKLDILGRGTGRIEVTAIDPRKFPNKNYTTIAKNSKNKIPVKQNNKQQTTLALNQANTPKPVAKSAATANGSPIYRYLQVGAFNSKKNAESLRQQILQLANTKLPVHIQTSSADNMPIFRVRIGPIKDSAMLNKLKAKLVQARLPIPVAIP